MTQKERRIAAGQDCCIGCGTELIWALDADPDGELGCVCVRCQAEESHDFDEEPHVKFSRRGECANIKELHRRAIKPIREAFEAFIRTGVWGTCDLCPLLDGKRIPELCVNAKRCDHQLPLGALVEKYAWRLDSVVESRTVV